MKQYYYSGCKAGYKWRDQGPGLGPRKAFVEKKNTS